MDISTYIKRMNQLYGTDPVPVRYNTQQYLQGGRVQYKPGGLVEPGVMYYGKATVDDPAQGVKAGAELGDNIYQTKGGYILQMGSGDNRVTRYRKSLDEVKAYRDQVLSEGWQKRKTSYSKTGSMENLFKDELFEQFFDAELKLTKGTKGGKGREEIKKAIAELPENATLKQKWDHLLTKDYKWRQFNLYPILRKFEGKYKRDAGYLSLKQLADFTNFTQPTLREAFYFNDLYKGVMPDVTKVSSAEYSKAKRGFEIVKQLEDIGITQQKIPGTYKASPTGKFKGKLALRLFNLPDDDQIIQLRNMVKMKGEEPITTRGLISKASKNSPEYLKMEYGKDRGNMNKLLKALNASVRNLDEVELLKLIKNNPALEELVTSHFNSVAGEIQPVKLDDLTFKEIKDRIGFEKEHVRSFKTVKMDPVTKEVLDGLDIEYPKHLRISISGFNNPFKESAEKWVQTNIKNINDPIIKGKIDKIDNFFTKFGQAYSIVDPTTNKRVIRGATESNLLKNIQALGFKEEMFDPKLIANIKERSFDSFQDGIFKQAAKAGIGPNCKKFNVGGSYAKCMQNAIDNEVKLAKSGGKGSAQAINKLKGVGRWAGKWFGLIDLPIELAFALPSLVRGDIEGAKASTSIGLFGWGKTEAEQMKERNPEAYKYWKHYDDTMNHFQLQWQKNDLEKKLEGFKTTGTYGQDVKNEMLRQLKETEDQIKFIEDNYIGYDTEKEMNLGYQSLQTDIQDVGAERQKKAWSFDKREEVDLPDTVAGHFMRQNLERSKGAYQTNPIIERLGLERDFILPDKPGASPIELQARYGKENLRKYYEDQRRFNLMHQGNIDPRVPFGKGKVVKGIDEGRRAFMKWLAGITGTTIAAGTGLLKWGKVAGKGKTVVKAADHVVQGTSGMPDWYIPLINRIVKEGDDVTAKLATKEREIVHTKKIEGHDVDVYQNLDTGDIRVVVEGGTGKHLTAYDGGLELEYRAPEIIESGKYRGGKTNPDFNVAETEAGYYRTGPEDADLDISFNTQGRPTKYDKKSGTVVVDESKATTDGILSDTNFLKNYAKKKKSNMGEIVETTKKKQYNKHLDDNPHEDPRIPEGPEPDVGMDEFGNLVDDYGEIID